MSDSPGPNYGPSRTAPSQLAKAAIIRVKHSVFTRAGCDLAWKIFSNRAHWPSFCDKYGDGRWTGIPWAAGSQFLMEIPPPEPLLIECIITLCVPPQCVAWITNVWGHSMQHCLLLEPYLGGGTKVTTWIELAELGPGTAKLEGDLKSVLRTWFNRFVAECDYQARKLEASQKVEPSRE
jgi:hypothetical protein